MSLERGWIARSSAAMTGASLHLFIGVDAPQPLLFDPAIETVAGDVAPARRALLDLGHDAGLQAGRDRTGLIGAIIERCEFVLGLHADNGGGGAPQQRVENPPPRALPNPPPPPLFQFRGGF